MSNAQEYIDALRQRDYYKFSKLIDFVTIKYIELLNRRLDSDELKSLIVYELSTTDINSEDIQKVNFFYNYLFFRNTELSKSMLILTELTTNSTIALAIKDDPDSKHIIQSTKIVDKDEVELFLQGEHYPFKALKAACLSKSVFDLREICNYLEEQELQEVCYKMERQHFFNFVDSIKSLTK